MIPRKARTSFESALKRFYSAVSSFKFQVPFARKWKIETAVKLCRPFGTRFSVVESQGFRPGLTYSALAGWVLVLRKNFLLPVELGTKIFQSFPARICYFLRAGTLLVIQILSADRA